MKTVTINDLEWQYEDDGIKRTWDEAQEYAKSLGRGWRLPTIHELFSIVDVRRYNPACRHKLECRSSYYWSGTTVAGHPHFAWGVDFYFGFGFWYVKGYFLYVRCVHKIPTSKNH